MSRRAWLTLGLLSVAIVLIACGLLRGEGALIWQKASAICLECVGLG